MVKEDLRVATEEVRSMILIVGIARELGQQVCPESGQSLVFKEGQGKYPMLMHVENCQKGVRV
jgi:hypothetical protein